MSTEQRVIHLQWYFQKFFKEEEARYSKPMILYSATVTLTIYGFFNPVCGIIIKLNQYFQYFCCANKIGFGNIICCQFLVVPIIIAHQELTNDSLGLADGFSCFLTDPSP